MTAPSPILHTSLYFIKVCTYLHYPIIYFAQINCVKMVYKSMTHHSSTYHMMNVHTHHILLLLHRLLSTFIALAPSHISPQENQHPKNYMDPRSFPRLSLLPTPLGILTRHISITTTKPLLIHCMIAGTPSPCAQYLQCSMLMNLLLPSPYTFPFETFALSNQSTPNIERGKSLLQYLPRNGTFHYHQQNGQSRIQPN